MRFRGMSDRKTGAGRPAGPENWALDEWNSKFFVNDKQNPYTTTDGKPFLWIRGRQVGGRSIIWGRQSYRWSDLDFEANLREGIGVDWPIRYARNRSLVRPCGRFHRRLGPALRDLPQLPDGKFLPPMELNCAELVVKDAVAKYFPGERIMTIGRTAILTQRHNGRAALPLLRSVRTRLHHALLLQQPELHFAGGADHRQGDACVRTASCTA